nr:LysM domain-containing protein [Bacillus suaedaesalsae]
MKTKINPKASSQDVLALPPRSKVHNVRDEKKKTKVKFKYPLVRFLAFLFVLLPVAILVYTFYLSSELQEKKQLPKKREQSPYKEEISINLNNDETIIHSQGYEEESSAVNEEEYKILFHTVQAEETLYTISQHYYNSREGEALIKEWNDLDTNEVTNGQVLKIPLK